MAEFFWKRHNECLPNFEVFNRNEFLQTSNDLDDSEISLFIEENRNVNTTKKTNTDLNIWKRCASPLKKQRPLKKFLARNVTIFYLISLTKSGNSTDCVFNNCTIVSLSNPHRYLFQTEDAWLLIRTKMTALDVRLDCFEFCSGFC